MQTIIISALAAIASAVAGGMTVSVFRRVAKDVDKGAITVINKRTGKTATLPRNYSPAAVEQLLEVAA